jgi:hypothetical protein
MSAQGGGGEAESRVATPAPLACLPDLAASSEERLLAASASGISCRFLCDQDLLEGDSAGIVCWAAADEGESRGLAGDARLPAGPCSLAAPLPPPDACVPAAASLRSSCTASCASPPSPPPHLPVTSALNRMPPGHCAWPCIAPCMTASPRTTPTQSCAQTAYCALTKSNTNGPRQQACRQAGEARDRRLSLTWRWRRASRSALDSCSSSLMADASFSRCLHSRLQYYYTPQVAGMLADAATGTRPTIYD